MRQVLLLTACVHTGAMPNTALTDSGERLRQYEEALRFYLRATRAPVVVCDNSGHDFAPAFPRETAAGRLECLALRGNDFDPRHGKGYGEMSAIRHALAHSRLIGPRDTVAKVTGRLLVTNIARLLRAQRLLPGHPIQTMHTRDDFADSRLVIAPRRFWEERLLPFQPLLDEPRGVYFEHLLRRAVAERPGGRYVPFLLMPVFRGVSGTTGRAYLEPSDTATRLAYLRAALGCMARGPREMARLRLPGLLLVQSARALLRLTAPLL